jgi:hypothetical protein
MRKENKGIIEIEITHIIAIIHIKIGKTFLEHILKKYKQIYI